MTDWMLLVYYFVGGVMVLVMALGLGVAVSMPGLDRWSRRFFIAYFSVLLLCMGAVFMDAVAYGNPALVRMEKAATCMEYLLVSILMPMLTVYLLRCCGENPRGSALLRAVSILWCVYFILLVIAQFTTVFYYVTPDCLFYRSSWHPLLLAPMVAVLILNLAFVLRRRSVLSGKRFHAFLIYLLPITLAMLIHMFVFVPLFIDIGISICALVMIGIILLDEIDQYRRQQREIAHESASIMVLQMRPHFIYNTMMSIYYLCDQDPQKAKQVTLDFTTYLRKNFTAIASGDTIPFSEELEHTRAYLAVEQTQFEGMLFVEYDTSHTLFRLPPLTLQPIVENAVKHGLDPDGDLLRIRIQTRETDDGSLILVEDNGPGYEPADDDEPHIALANIRQRLKLMCGGQLTITPREGGGTAVKMTIPENRR